MPRGSRSLLEVSSKQRRRRLKYAPYRKISTKLRKSADPESSASIDSFKVDCELEPPGSEAVKQFDCSGTETFPDESLHFEQDIDSLTISVADVTLTENLPEQVFDIEDFKDDLRNWGIQNNITHTAMSQLLKCLKSKVPSLYDLPKDARTLLKTPKTVEVKAMGSGKFFHFGIEYNLRNCLHSVNALSIQLCINIDGLPLFKSSKGQFWPICGNLINIPEVEDFVFIISLYYGTEKPPDVNEFLQPFIDEANALYDKGLLLDGSCISVKTEYLCLDVPARSFVLGTKGHTGHSSCFKCTVFGEYINRRMCFPQINEQPRTHESFLAQEDPDFHKIITKITELKGLDLINGVILDCMHLVYLGNVKKLVDAWVNGLPNKKHKLPAAKIFEISEFLQTLTAASYIPSTFGREPRSLSELSMWKATEFRGFLLYTGVVALKSTLDSEAYSLFLLLHASMTVFVREDLCVEANISKAEVWCKKFVTDYSIVYGKEYVSHNVHTIIHLPNDARKIGPLDKHSAFKFENKLQQLKKSVRRRSLPLEQAVNRIFERNVTDSKVNHKDLTQLKFSKEYQCSEITLPTCSDARYRKVEFSKFIINTDRAADSVCGTRGGAIVMVETIAFCEKQNSFVIVGKEFLTKESLYKKPIDSKVLGIFFVSKLSKLKIWLPKDILCQYFLMPMDHSFAAFPLNHSFLG